MNLSAIADMPPAIPRTDRTQPTIYLIYSVVILLLLLLLLYHSFLCVLFVALNLCILLCSCVASVIGFVAGVPAH